MNTPRWLTVNRTCSEIKLHHKTCTLQLMCSYYPELTRFDDFMYPNILQLHTFHPTIKVSRKIRWFCGRASSSAETEKFLKFHRIDRERDTRIHKQTHKPTHTHTPTHKQTHSHTHTQTNKQLTHTHTKQLVISPQALKTMHTSQNLYFSMLTVIGLPSVLAAIFHNFSPDSEAPFLQIFTTSLHTHFK